jgi:hypothetical protein
VSKMSHPILRVPRRKLLRLFIIGIEAKIDAAITDDDTEKIAMLTRVRDAWLDEYSVLVRIRLRRLARGRIAA